MVKRVFSMPLRALQGFIDSVFKLANIPLFCPHENIQPPANATVSNAFKELRKSHPALLATGNRAAEITRILNSFATSIDAFSTLRNHASLAHVNELLDVPEATATINAMHTIFRYVQDCLTRQNQLY
jgi:hypothetical protein